MEPTSRLCVTCGRRFEFRARWARDWEQVRACSRACQGGPGPLDRALEDAIQALLEARAPGATICPSEAARAVRPEGWRPLLERARRAARRLAHQGRLEITQRGRAVDPCAFKGPIRLRARGGAGARGT